MFLLIGCSIIHILVSHNIVFNGFIESQINKAEKIVEQKYVRSNTYSTENRKSTSTIRIHVLPDTNTICCVFYSYLIFRLLCNSEF